ncbi:MAG: flagellar filament capping protein FliD [Woeseiaceae bacterium]
MVGIISSGIGSGLDVQGLVQQLVEAEGAPAQQRFVLSETRFQSRLSAYGSLSSALDSLKTNLEKLSNAESTAAKTISTSNEDAVSVSVTEAAVPASYTVDIVNKASTARLTSGSFTGSDAIVGTGTLTLSIGTDSFDVEIDAESNTLAGIRDSINGSSNNTGVQATIINADAGSYLVLSGTKTGEDNSITVTQADGDGGLSVLSYDPENGLNDLTQTQAAQNAAAVVNGFAVFSDTNDFSAVIDGVTFSAVEATNGETFTIDVSNDTSGLKSTLQSFVSAYNGFVDTTDSLAAFDPDTNVAGPLQGDSALRSVSSQLRQELSAATTGADSLLDTLNEIGIRTDETGQLTTDAEQLDAILANDFTAISNLFGGDSGYSARLTTIIDEFTGDNGIIQSRTEGIEASIELIDEQREALNSRLISLEARLFRQFNGLDSLLGQLNTTSSFLTAQLANLPTPGDN